jgi:nickel superoxide dismutase
MIKKVLRLLDKISPPETIHAHCDVPCGIYDPRPAQIAAETVEKMVEKLITLPMPTSLSKKALLDYTNTAARMIYTKEEHAEICKREILILWTDFFNEENSKKYPELHDLVWKTTKLCSDNKRALSQEKAKQLRENVDKIAEIFKKVTAASH